MQLKFYACPHCGNQLLFLNRTQPPAPCCCQAIGTCVAYGNIACAVESGFLAAYQLD